jgi:hypothetical protein
MKKKVDEDAKKKQQLIELRQKEEETRRRMDDASRFQLPLGHAQSPRNVDPSPRGRPGLEACIGRIVNSMCLIAFGDYFDH